MHGTGHDIREPRVSASLEVLAHEIELASARALSLDGLMGEVMQGLTAEHRSALLRRMHEADLLTQHLTSLAAFARGLGDAACPTLTVPVESALSAISLGALAERMAAGLNGGAVSARADSGDVDLF
jgi:hypothetical protein